ncbi:YitT family protein [Cohnella pontilimi]|uniref:YitT family protein n=1 Tax=Cohnella pontilimi TaxID=2564100 RepID=A0A4U0FF49_9BACL|nr:YitT family protein [Cohnella pontilimi]TJY41972.1 YitT family protein [Cohnella pontilimi]
MLPTNKPIRVSKSKRSEKRRPRLSPWLQEVVSYVYLLVGSLIIAFAFNLFLLPNKIASGGVAGVSVVLNTVFDVPPAYTQWALNIPLLIAGLLILGGRFGIKTAIGSLMMPLLILLTSHADAPSHNPLLGAIYGGLGVGLGLGIVFRGRSSTGGLDIAAQILHRLTGIRYGLAVAAFDACVIISAGLFISIENALYALLALFVTSKTIDFVQTGLQTSKAAFIVTNYPEQVSQAILHDLDRGLTRLHGQGGYTGEERPVLLAVVGQNEVAKLKALVRDADPSAFVIISNTAEVLGEGFHEDH